VDPKKAAEAEVVLAVQQGLIIGVFIPEKLPATTKNFPGTSADLPGRRGFVGKDAPENIAKLYLRCRLPKEMLRRGAANPVRYVDPEKLPRR
jgi:uncharacterized protein